MICLIAAIGPFRELGKNNDLCYTHPADMKRFVELTVDHPVIMGRRTAESLPSVLRDRLNLVLTHDREWRRDGFLEMYDIHEALAYAQSYNDCLPNGDSDKIFVIGGAKVYKQFLDANKVDKIYLTQFSKPCPDADVHFPVLGNRWKSSLPTETVHTIDRNIGTIRFTILEKETL